MTPARRAAAQAHPFVHDLATRVLAAALEPGLGDNVDPERFPDGMTALTPEQSARRLAHLLGHAGELDWLAARLDPPSRRLLADRLTFHVLGHTHARIGPSRAEVDALLAAAQGLVTEAHLTELAFAGSSHSHTFDLRALGVPATLESYTLGIQGTFQLQQYRAPDRPWAWPRAGDIAIDAGGCFGETALWLAHAVGPTGRVVTLELDPGNLAILRANLARNPGLAGRVEVIEAALWERSGERRVIDMAGPAATIAHPAAATAGPAAHAVRGAPAPSTAPAISTIGLDDLVDQRELSRVDFVKMDIEGAEPAAIAGAAATLRRFRPRLAIAVYHEIDHLWRLPRALDALESGYRLALGHFTMHGEETVLYAWTDPA